MISFKDFLSTTPSIQCGIGRGTKHLVEQIHAEPFLFSIPKDEDEKYPGDMISPGVMHVQRFGKPDVWYVHRRGNHPPIEFRDEQAALQFREMERRQHGKDLQKAHRTLLKHYEPVFSNKIHSEALDRYTRSSSLTNLGLIRGDEEMTPLVHMMDNATHAKNTPDHLVVYSGINSSHAAKLDTATMVHHPAFLSTSLSLPIARAFSHTQGSNSVMKIHVPAGHPGVYVGRVSNPFITEEEKEFVLPRGMNIRIDKSKEHILKTQDGDFRLHHCIIE